MNFKIKHIEISQFRCFEHLETDLWDRTTITASNEVGKSTVGSAILWTLTGRDANGDATFEIVPTGHYGEVSPTVTLECVIDDRPVTLKREYKAKFTRDKQFSDYAVTTYINGIETGVRKFADWVSQNICDEKVFKILSNPKTFVEDCPHEAKQLQWQAQRELLMSIIGGQKSDVELAKEDSKWAELEEPLNRYDNASQYLLYLKKLYSDAQKELDSFDIRVSEQEKNIVQLEHSEDEISEMVNGLKLQAAQLKASNEEYRNSQRSGHTDELKKALAEANAERDAIQGKYNEDKEVYDRTKAAYQAKADEIKAQGEASMQKLKTYAEAIDKLKAAKIKGVCDHCGQKLLPAQIDKIKADIVTRIRNGEKQTAELSNKVQLLRKDWEEAAKKVKEIMAPTYPAEKIENIQREILVLTDKLAEVVPDQDLPNFAADMQKLENQMDSLKEEYFKLKHNKEVESEIAKIEAEHKENVKKMSEIQRNLDLAKEFVSFKCKYAEDAINALFPTVRFQLFEKNKSNDDIKEVCNLTFNGHKYADLSASTKIIASLEVVRAFQKFYNVSVTLILDNFESVTGPVETGAQSIFMVVREELCPECGGHSGRRNPDGTWTCQKCNHIWKKTLEIKEG